LTDARVEIHLVHDLPGTQAACRLFAEVWEPVAPINVEVARAVTHAGGYLSLAEVAGDVVGASFGFLGCDERGWLLHSHVTGVRPGLESRHIGRALKFHQRAWAADRGIGRIVWTFDPLVRRNARFNLAVLGAEAVEYVRSFYGPMTDGINAGDDSDRLVVAWSTTEPAPHSRVVADDTVPLVLEVVEGEPVVCWTTADRVGASMPADIVEIRRLHPALALRWRYALRDVLERALATGYRIRTVTEGGTYLLER
jgi:predicted GNAT superfamily acetyltransferase